MGCILLTDGPLIGEDLQGNRRIYIGQIRPVLATRGENNGRFGGLNRGFTKIGRAKRLDRRARRLSRHDRRPSRREKAFSREDGRSSRRRGHRVRADRRFIEKDDRLERNASAFPRVANG